MFKRISGQSNLTNWPKKTSTAFLAGSVVSLDGTAGDFQATTTTSPSVLGVVQRTVASTDGDYASATPTLVDLNDVGAVWEVDVANGGAATPFVATDVGQFFKVGATASVIDCNTRSSTPGAGFTAQGLVFLCVGFISATTTVSDTTTGSGKGLFKIMSMSAVRPASS